VQARIDLVYPGYFCECRVTDPVEEALTALADASAERPAEEILFD
jgi:hypothetical protein